MTPHANDHAFVRPLTRSVTADFFSRVFPVLPHGSHFRLPMLILLLVFLLAGNFARAQSNLVLVVLDDVQPSQTFITTNGFAFSLTTTNAQNVVTGSTTAVINASGIGFHFQFAAPVGGSLTVGSYSNTVYAPFVDQTNPVMAVFGGGIDAAGESGNFQILELHTNQTGVVDRLWVAFDITAGPETCWGQIRFNSQLAPASDYVPQTFHVPEEYPTIQAAINAANGVITNTILVTNGIYHENLNFLGKFINLISVNGPQTTVIDGGLANPVIAFVSGEGPASVIRGFTIQNGYYFNGGGILLYETSPTIIGNIFQNNYQGAHGSGAAIGGLYASPIIEQNLFQNNFADDTFYSGVVGFSGASDPVIANNVFLKNSCCAINMSLFDYSTPAVVNNTIVSNTMGIHVVLGNATFTEVYDNNLLYGNRIGYQVDENGIYYGYGFPTWANNLVYGTTTRYVNLPDQTGANGNISADPGPFLACVHNDDLRLLAGSPCIDAGLNSAPGLPGVDFDGNPRILVGRTNDPAIVDIGACEFNPASPPDPCLYLVPPTNIVVTVAAGQNSAPVAYPAAVASPIGTVISLPPSGSIFPAGTNVVLCTLVYGTYTLTASFQVVVLVPPYVTTKPAIVNLVAGNNVTFDPGTIGSTPLNHHWLLDNVAIPNATNSSLTIFNAQAVNSGYYQVIVANWLGATTNISTVLQVIPSAPVVVSGPEPVTTSAGTMVSFSVNFVGSAPVNIQWYDNGVPLVEANAAQLVISNVQQSAVGNYSVVLSNSLGITTTTPASLTVVSARPSFVVQPASTADLVGSSVTFTCQATGTEDNWHPIKYAWYFQNAKLLGQTSTQLNLPAITATNAGNYFVVASNTYGSATSSVAQLNVYLPPAVFTGLSNEVVTAGDNVTIGVVASGNPAPAYNWSLNLYAGNLDPYAIHPVNSPLWSSGTLSNTTAFITLTNIRLSQAGYYFITVTNQFGSASSSAKISVLPPAAQVVAWGDNTGGQTDVPTNLDDVVALAGGDYHSVALRKNGTLVAWGADDEGQTDVPTNALPFVAIAAGAEHNLAIAADGNVVGWGNDDSGQTDIPAGVSPALSVAAGDSHSLALLSSGVVVPWGDDTFGQTNVPSSLVEYDYFNFWDGEGINSYQIFNGGWVPTQAIAAGRNHSLALMSGGTVVGWGDNGFGQCSPPANLTNAIAIAAGSLHSVALRSDGTVAAWGDDTFGETNVPPGLSNIVAIAAGDYHTYAMLSNGSTVAWGDDTFGQIDVPSSAANATAIASGYYHGLAMVPLRLYPQVTARKMVIQWHVPATLQWAPTPAGPYTDVPSPACVYTNTDMSSPAKFFRLRRE